MDNNTGVQVKNDTLSALLEDIPVNSKICIYGAGQTGFIIKKAIELLRKDIEIICYIDTLKSGKFADLDIIKVTDISQLEGKYDLILIASAFWQEIEKLLFQLNINNYIKINYQNYRSLMGSYCMSVMGQGFLINDKDKKNFSHFFEQVKSLLKYNEDKNIYDLVINARFSQKNFNDLQTVMKVKMNEQNQYLDFINKKAIKKIIEAGVCQGDNTLSFLSHFKNIEHIYGFEPLYENYKREPFSTFIKKSHKVSIILQALWSNKTQIKFNGWNVITDAIDQNNTEQSRPSFKIDAISIDEFVKENNIDKIDFIKMDIEGAELEALKGGERTIIGHRPQLAIAIYHTNEHLYEIPLYLDSFLDNYTYRVEHYKPSQYETIWYAIPNEKL